METKLKVEAGYCPCEGCLKTVRHAIENVCKRKGTKVVSVDIELENQIIILVGDGIDIQKLVDKLHKKRRCSKITILPSDEPKTDDPKTESSPSSPVHEVGESAATMEEHSSPVHEVEESAATMEEDSLLHRRSRVVMSSPTESTPPQLTHEPKYVPREPNGSPPVESMPPQLARQPSYPPQLAHEPRTKLKLHKKKKKPTSESTVIPSCQPKAESPPPSPPLSPMHEVGESTATMQEPSCEPRRPRVSENDIDIQHLIHELQKNELPKKKSTSKSTVLPSHEPNREGPPASPQLAPMHGLGESTATKQVPASQPRRSRVCTDNDVQKIIDDFHKNELQKNKPTSESTTLPSHEPNRELPPVCPPLSPIRIVQESTATMQVPSLQPQGIDIQQFIDNLEKNDIDIQQLIDKLQAKIRPSKSTVLPSHEPKAESSPSSPPMSPPHEVEESTITMEVPSSQPRVGNKIGNKLQKKKKQGRS
ncbi:hypothetical protein LINGRAHAP2_LOCUS18994 [Linum grandiflorum]